MKPNSIVDNEAKLRVDLYQKLDGNSKPFYTGKLQFNGQLDFRSGQSFMIFTSESGSEQLHIGPVDPTKSHKYKNRQKSRAYRKDDRISIRLRKYLDNNQAEFYVGEVHGDFSIKCTQGLFFTVFTSISDREELQITKLNTVQKNNDNIIVGIV